MKHFTEPSGRFLLEIPNDWQYTNPVVGFENTSPFGFQFHENPVGAFQISCYSAEEKPINNKMKVQKANTPNLEFIKSSIGDKEFTARLWYATVEDHMFMAKYIYDVSKEGDERVFQEIAKVEKALSTLILIPKDKRKLASDIAKYENFMSSLAASFDLRRNAIEKEALIELLVIIANQIDAYLRMSIVLTKQLRDNTDEVDIALLFQDNTDKPVMERKIYQQAKELKIIDQSTFDTLDKLHDERNKVIHRYIISDFKTRFLYQIIFDYENVCEVVRIALQKIEELQGKRGVGVCKRGLNVYTEEDVQMLFSQVNDKHLLKELHRPTKT